MNARLPPRLRAYSHVARARALESTGLLHPRPYATHFIVTWRCNLRCTGCDAWQRDAAPELNADQWRRIFEQIPTLDIVKIIGGEPFVRDDLADIVNTIREVVDPFILQLVTNATLTERVLSFVEQHAWPGLHLRVSLDGLEETHDNARGVTGTYLRVMKTLEGLARIKERRRFQLAVNFTLTDDSIADMAPLLDLCRSLGVDLVPGFKVKPFLRHCNVANENVTTIGLQDRRVALPRLVSGEHGARQGFNSLEKRILRGINRIVFRKHARGGDSLKFRCREVRNLMYLNPYGELMTCGLNHDPIGNLLEEGFEAVWHSERAQAAREKVDQCPGCMQGAVEVMSSLYG